MKPLIQMTYNKIILAGGNGYLGTVLAEYYKTLAKEVVILSRKSKAEKDNIRTIVWDGQTEGSWTESLTGADLLINLCGKNVNCRYTAANRAEIIDSRVAPTLLLGKILAVMKSPPKLWINITSATIYRHAEDHAQDEETGEIGYGFSIEVCRKWEEAFFSMATPLTRKIALRMAVVLGRADGAFPRLFNLVKCGLGGKQGDGQQYMSWVHEQDAAKCTEWLLQNDNMEGVINCAAPEALKNTDFMCCIRKAYGMPVGLPAPAWLLGIGVLIIGTEMELILKSRWVAPKRLLDHGFTFMFPKAAPAINDLLSIRV